MDAFAFDDDWCETGEAGGSGVGGVAWVGGVAGEAGVGGIAIGVGDEDADGGALGIDGVDEEADDARLVGTHRVVHAGDLVAGVVFDPG